MPGTDVSLVILGDRADTALIPPQDAEDWIFKDVHEYLEPEPDLYQEREAWHRRMDACYNDLRHKLVIRLVVVQLGQDENAIPRVAADWRTLADRLARFNAERTEQMSLATILIVAGGDLQQKHRAGLEELAKAPCADSQWTHRVYLMTRKLELGTREVLHSHYVWPVMVHGLLRHLRWQARYQHHSTHADTGFFAWRFVEFVFDVNEQLVSQSVRSIQEVMQQKLLGAHDAPAMQPRSNAPAAASFDAGLNQEQPQATGGQWWGDPAAARSTLWHPSGSDVRTYASDVRARTFARLKSDAAAMSKQSTDADADSPMAEDWRTIVAVREAIENCPFPKPPPFAELEVHDVRDGEPVLEAFSSLDAAASQAEALRDRSLEELELARKHLVGDKDRWIIGISLSMALAYCAASAIIVLHSAFEFLPVWQHGWVMKAGLAMLVAVAGVAACVLLSRWLQDWRGRLAGGRALLRASEALAARTDRVHQSCLLLRTSDPVRPWHWRVTLREAMQQRFQRLHEIVAHEWIPSSADDDRERGDERRHESTDLNQTGQLRIARKAMSILIPCSGRPLDAGELEQLGEQEVQKFRNNWSELLNRLDPDDRSFLPAAPICEFFTSIRSGLDEIVRARMAESVRAQMQAEPQTTTDMADRTREVGGAFPNFASVDLGEGSRFESTLFAPQTMMRLLDRIVPARSFQPQIVGETTLPAHVVGVLFAEAQLTLGSAQAGSAPDDRLTLSTRL